MPRFRATAPCYGVLGPLRSVPANRSLEWRGLKPTWSVVLQVRACLCWFSVAKNLQGLRAQSVRPQDSRDFEMHASARQLLYASLLKMLSGHWVCNSRRFNDSDSDPFPNSKVSQMETSDADHQEHHEIRKGRRPG